jgi:CHAD domain-containing protein
MGNLLKSEERTQVEALAMRAGSPAVRRRAQVLLLYDDGLPTREVAERAGLSRGRARFWRGRYQKQGLEVFSGQSGAPQPASADTGEPAGPVDPPALAPTKTPKKSRVKAGLPEENGAGLQPDVDGPPAGQDRAGEQPPAVLPSRAEKRAAEKAARAAQKAERAAGRLQQVLSLERPGIQPGDPLSEAGRKVMAYQFAEVLRHEAGTRLGEDIEALHDMRVATRRLRAAFEVFEQAFDPKTVKAHLKGLRATGRALGRVRDLDVFMEKARRYLDSLPEDHRQGLDPLLNAWGQDRETGREEMLAHLDSADYAAFKRKFAGFVTTPGEGTQADAQDPALPGLVRHVAPVLIYTRLAAVRAYEPLLDTASIEQLHALRIEFKKLRYTLEFFREVLGKEVKEVINGIKTLQDHLGDLNDAEVACQILRAFLDDWETRQLDLPVSARQNPEPIVAYLAAKHAERHHLMVTFRPAWAVFDRPEVRNNIAMAVSIL